MSVIRRVERVPLPVGDVIDPLDCHQPKGLARVYAIRNRSNHAPYHNINSSITQLDHHVTAMQALHQRQDC